MVYRTKKKYNSRKIKNKTKRNKTKRNKTKRNKTKRNKTKRKTVKLGGRPTKKSWLPSWENVQNNTRKAWEKVKHNGSQLMKSADIKANKLQLRTTSPTSDNYRGRVFNLANKVGSYNTTHMEKEYDNTEITPECDAKTPKTCRCTSKEGRVQDLLNMSENGGVCTKCGEQCPRTQKILENYKRLDNLDLESLPFTRFGRLLYNRSKFPAYYKGYMTPSRIETYIRYLLEQQPQIIQTDEKLTQMLNYPYPPMYRYDTNGYMISTCSDIYRGTKAPKIIENCNKIFKYINDLNKNLDEDPNNTKIYILFEHDKLHKLLLVDKDVFTKKYRSAIIDMEVPKEVTLANTYVGELLGADTVIGEGGITRDSWDSGRATIGSDIDRSSIYSDRSSMDSIDYDRSSQ